ncbi:hypothetical protein [Nocardia mangyaensis]|uniref:hypothetical protein n=1 Tax=Nocardia mangyaensis TaxID=2213200 RepID=UPI000B22251F|nr:hypothetical protein [Nocardia mangyaensis]
MVLDEVWRGLDGVDALSGPHGGPLRRTVKLIVDPLVIRPMQHPACAATVLDADGVTLLTALVHARADVLRDCAAWFTVLKQVRRALRITEGNAQDLYFQRCFELATVHGAPEGDRGRATAEATLREIHESTGGRTTAALKSHVTEQQRATELNVLLDLAWRRRPLAGYGPRDRSAELTELLDACTFARDGDPADAGPLLDDLIRDHVGTHRGIALWNPQPAHGADDLGLTAHPVPVCPSLGATASTANLALPLDRTIYERVFTVLQGSIDRVDLPEIPDLVTTEISRSCSPWGLLDESLRVAAATGCELALGLSPMGNSAAGGTALGASGTRTESVAVERGRLDPLGSSQPASAADGMGSGVNASAGNRAGGYVVGKADMKSRGDGSRAHEVVNGRWRREGYVLQARRYAVHAADGSSGPLAVVAEDLRRPWRPYLRRLWVRLHGRDVRDLPVYEAGELWDLLDGVARSVILDHRTRVRQALTAEPVAVPEARAS